MHNFVSKTYDGPWGQKKVDFKIISICRLQSMQYNPKQINLFWSNLEY